MKNYTIFQNSKPQSIGPISKQDFDRYNYSNCIDTKKFPIRSSTNCAIL